MATEKNILLKIVEVRFKKREGTLLLMNEFLVWVEDECNKVTEIHEYSDIKFLKLSPAGKPKVKLQIVLVDDSSLTFHFVNREGQEAILADRQQVKDMLEFKLMGNKVDLELIRRNRILAENAKLLQTYKDLVITDVIPSSVFWEMYDNNNMVEKSHNLRIDWNHVVGTTNPTTADGCNGLHSHLTPRIIEKVFSTYPSIEETFKQNVPHKMTEKEFWKQFLESDFFHRQRVPNPNIEGLHDAAHGSVQSGNIDHQASNINNEAGGLLDVEQTQLKLIELTASWMERTPIEKILPPSAALNVMAELSFGGSLMLGPSRVQKYPPIPPEIDEEYDHLYDSLQVLTKQFWTRFAAKTPDCEGKISFYHDAIMLFKEKLIEPFTNRVASTSQSLASLTQPLICMAETVHAKYVLQMTDVINQMEKNEERKTKKKG